MLVLSRRRGESIRIGDDIEIHIVRIGPQTVRVGIKAPRDVRVMRTELLEAPSEAGSPCSNAVDPARMAADTMSAGGP